MQEYIVNRPQPEALQRILEEHRFDAAGTIIRLAWREGLLRDEITGLTWNRVSFLNDQLELPDRQVPMLGEMRKFLEELSQLQPPDAEYVVLSDRLAKPLTPQHASRLVRQVLDEAGQPRVRLVDLRYDFIIRALRTEDWQAVSRMTGMEAVSLLRHFSPHLEGQKLSTRADGSRTLQIDEFRLWKLLHKEGDSQAGLTLRLTWQAGLCLEEITSLTWGQLDCGSRCLHLSSGRTVELRSDLFEVLERLSRGRDAGGSVLLSPRAREPLRPDRLSKIARTALIRGGMDDVTLRSLRMDCQLRAGGEAQVVRYVQQNGYVTATALAELLGVSKKTAFARLKLLLRRGKLTRVGIRYYLPGTVVPADRQCGAVLAYLHQTGGAYRGDITELLHIGSSQCSLLLRRMVADGEICHEKQRYYIKDA